MTPRIPKQKAAAQSLDQGDWIRAAQAVMATDGVDAVRVEPLAKRLNVTKGSFYWHFKDRNELLEGLLADWRRRAVAGVHQRVVRTHDTPLERLRRLIHFPVSSAASRQGGSVELAIRLWGKRDRKAAAAVEEVDEHRISYIASLLSAPGVTEERARAQAFLIYAYMLAEVFVFGPEGAELADLCENMLFSLSSLQDLASVGAEPSPAAPE
jgi:AcrR family transcriptional regulator